MDSGRDEFVDVGKGHDAQLVLTPVYIIIDDLTKYIVK